MAGSTIDHESIHFTTVRTRDAASSTMRFVTAVGLVVLLAATATIGCGDDEETDGDTDESTDGDVTAEYVLDVTDGRRLTGATLADDGTLYLSSQNGSIYAYEIDGNGGEKLWSFDTDDEISGPPSVGDDGTVYVTSRDGYLYALDGDEDLWSTKASQTAGAVVEIRGSAALGPDEEVYVLSNQGVLYAIDTDDGEQNWDKELSASVTEPSSSPVVHGDTIYTNRAWQHAVDRTDNSLIWNSQDTADGVTNSDSTPAIGDDGTVYVGGSYTDDFLWAFNPDDGTTRWGFETENTVRDPVVGPDGTIYVASDDNNLYAIDPDDGEEEWHFDVGGPYVGAPVVGDNGVVYVGGDDSIYAIDTNDGSEVWSLDTGASIRRYGALLDDDGMLYVGNSDGDLYVIETEADGRADSSWPMYGGDERRTGFVAE